MNALYEALLEQNLLKLTEPYSKVEIAHIAKMVNLDVLNVESKLSKMILDKKLCGILDQGSGCLIILEDQKVDVIFI